MKVVLRGNFVAPSAYIKKVEKAHTSNLTVLLKDLEQKEADSSRSSRQQEIFELMAEVNKIETRKKCKESIKQRASSL